MYARGQHPAGRSLLRKTVVAIVIALAAAQTAPLGAANSDLERAQAKLDAIEAGRIKPGYAVTFSEREVNAWANERVPGMFQGIRDPRVQLGAGTVTTSAMIDFLEVRKAVGQETNSVFSKLLEGERPVRVVLRVQSGGGLATVSPERLEVSGVPVSGSVLDFLVTKFFVPLFPEAKVDQPFELRDDIERIEIRPGALRVVIKK